MHFRIELVRPEDLPAIAALVNSGYRGQLSRAGWTTEADLFEGERTNAESLAADILANPGRFMLALREGASLEGCVALEPNYAGNPQLCYLGMLTVRPDRQAGGLGRRLLEAAEEKARELGAQAMTLCVLTPRTELMLWYERRGYRRTGERKPFPYATHATTERPTRDDLEFVYFRKEI